MTFVYPNLAFIGLMGVGKTTCANLFVDRHGYRRLAFADAIKNDVTEMLNLALERGYEEVPYDEVRIFKDGSSHISRDTLEEFKSSTFRTLLQWYGTDFWRQFMGQPDYWLHRLEATIDAHDGPVVVDDCRFPNEVEFLKNRNFRIVRILRTTQNNGELSRHLSETALDDYEADVTIDVDGVPLKGLYDFIVGPTLS